MSVLPVTNNNTNYLEILLSHAEKTLNSFQKYLYNTSEGKKLVDYLWIEFSSAPNTCMARIREISFSVFKFLYPHLPRKIYSTSLTALPLLGLLYSSEEAKTGKLILKKPTADAIQKTLSNLSQVSKLEREAFFYFLSHTDQTTALTFMDQLFSHPAAGPQLLRVLTDGYGPSICVKV